MSSRFPGLAAAVGVLVALAALPPVRADEPSPEPAVVPTDDTSTALADIQREADQRRAKRQEMERLKREVDRNGPTAGRRAVTARSRPNQAQIRAARARQRQQVQAALRGVGPRPVGPMMTAPFPFRPTPGPSGSGFQVFRGPNGGGFATFWGVPPR